MKSKILIVDETDTVIAEKHKDEVKSEDIYRISSLWITDSKGNILLAKRALTKKHSPGKWGPAVQGTVDSGETYRDNIIKEADEEIGLTNITPIPGIKERVIGIHNYFVQEYSLKLDRDISDFTIQKEEVAEIQWIAPETLDKELAEHPDQFLKSVRRWREFV
jgi:isopentenyl-diphosphate delta-isomerase